MPYDSEASERVRNILSGRKDVEEKKLMGGLCFMVQQAMCCSVSGKGGLLVRVEPSQQVSVLNEAHASPMTMGKRTMKGFVRVAPEGYKTDGALRRWIERGIEAALAVEANPRKAKKKSC